MRRIVLGTRGSDLARAQTSLVEKALRNTSPEVEIVIEIIRTRGDEKSSDASAAPQGRKGLFTGEIERAVREGEIDLAIHSAKDLPSETASDLEICAALPRAEVADVLIAKSAENFAALPAGATVATGSVRRQHQLRASRDDLQIVDLRGNVPTRVRKLIDNPWDAIILARAGLDRLGFDCRKSAIEFEGQMLCLTTLPIDDFLPAGGQGIVALQIRADDAETRGLVVRLNHLGSLLCLRAEREFLRLLQGDCGTPVGVLASVSDGWMNLRAQVFAESQRAPKISDARARLIEKEPESLAATLFHKMYGEEK